MLDFNVGEVTHGHLGPLHGIWINPPMCGILSYGTAFACLPRVSSQKASNSVVHWAQTSFLKVRKCLKAPFFFAKCGA